MNTSALVANIRARLSAQPAFISELARWHDLLTSLPADQRRDINAALGGGDVLAALVGVLAAELARHKKRRNATQEDAL